MIHNVFFTDKWSNHSGHWRPTLCMLMLDWFRFTVGGVAGTRKSAPFSLSVSEVGRSGYIRGERGGALGALSDSNSDTCDISSSRGGVLMKASSTSSVEQTVYKEVYVNLITVLTISSDATFQCSLLFKENNYLRGHTFNWNIRYAVKCSFNALPAVLAAH